MRHLYRRRVAGDEQREDPEELIANLEFDRLKVPYQTFRALRFAASPGTQRKLFYFVPWAAPSLLAGAASPKRCCNFSRARLSRILQALSPISKISASSSWL